jgi:hypothetical protein
MTPKWIMLSLMISANCIGAYVMHDTGMLIGDLSALPLYSHTALAWALFLVVSSYIIILGPVFDVIGKFKVHKISFSLNENVIGEKIGVFLLMLQILFMAFNLYFGVNIAGAERSEQDIPFSLFWVFVPADALMFVYYGFYRENKMFYPNALVWFLSNFLRGWTGMIPIIFFEWCRASRNGRLKIKWIFIMGIIVAALYPVIISLKWIFRSMATANIKGLAAIFETLRQSLEIQDYWNLITDGFLHILGRLQTTSSVVEMIHLQDFLQYELASNKFTPFWMEGLHGLIFQKFFFDTRILPIGVAITKYINFGWNFEVGSWNMNIGHVGWFFIDPFNAPFYILYNLFLGFLSVFLLKKIGMSDQARDMVWYAWLIYLMAPWHMAYINFVYAMMLFLIIKLFINNINQQTYTT